MGPSSERGVRGRGIPRRSYLGCNLRVLPYWATRSPSSSRNRGATACRFRLRFFCIRSRSRLNDRRFSGWQPTDARPSWSRAGSLDALVGPLSLAHGPEAAGGSARSASKPPYRPSKHPCADRTPPRVDRMPPRAGLPPWPGGVQEGGRREPDRYQSRSAAGRSTCARVLVTYACPTRHRTQRPCDPERRSRPDGG